MDKFSLSKHAEVRMNQRGLRKIDINFVLEMSTLVAPDVFLMTNDDVNREIGRRKHEIRMIEKLRGMKIVIAGDTIVTAYRSKPSDQAKILRRGRHHQ